MRKILLMILLVFLLTSVTASASAWEYKRPPSTMTFPQERDENSYTDGKASVGIGVHITDYLENSGSFDYNDTLLLSIAATANTRKIISYGAYSDTYSWHDNLPHNLSLSDDSGAWVPMEGVIARFYGGLHT